MYRSVKDTLLWAYTVVYNAGEVADNFARNIFGWHTPRGKDVDYKSLIDANGQVCSYYIQIFVIYFFLALICVARFFALETS